MNNFTCDNATKSTVAICLISSPPPKRPSNIKIYSAGEAHTASGALVFGKSILKLGAHPTSKCFPSPWSKELSHQKVHVKSASNIDHGHFSNVVTVFLNTKYHKLKNFWKLFS